MATKQTIEVFGQLIPTTHLSPMAHAIACAIGNGKPVIWAGFVWYHPHPLRREDLVRTEVRSAAQDAA